jgi:hypothetical protein
MEERANNIFNTLKQKGDIIKFDYIDKLWNTWECIINIANQSLIYNWENYNIKDLTDGATILNITFWEWSVIIEWKKFFVKGVKELSYNQLLSWLDDVLPWYRVASK